MSEPTKIYVSGVSIFGKSGIGVWFGPDSPDNISEALEGAEQTYNRASIIAATKALKAARASPKPITIYVDNPLLFNAVSSYLDIWLERDYKKKDGEDVTWAKDFKKLAQIISQIGSDNIKWVSNIDDCQFEDS